MNTNLYMDIPDYKSWKEIVLIEKGYSTDKKYLVTTDLGEHLLLRISDVSEFDIKKKEYDIIRKFTKSGFTMSEPLSFGICNNGNSVYMILSWVEGRDLEDELGKLSEQQQYLLGRQAGKILKEIHSICVDKEDLPQKTKIDKKLLQLEKYENSKVRVPNDEDAIRFVKQNINNMWRKPPVYLHGDYHPGNLIYVQNENIGVIDFNRWEVGDPYEEFYKLESFGIEESIPYCVGQIDEYFNDAIPTDFWETLAVYVAHASLYSVKWAEKFGSGEIEGMKKRCKIAFENYNNFKEVVPVWYDHTLRLKYAENMK